MLWVSRMRADRKQIHRVKLRFSMRQLDARLKKDSTGYTNPKLWIKESPLPDKSPGQFVWVAFDNGAHATILWGCLQRQNEFGEWVDE
jgi:hypothetical protein